MWFLLKGSLPGWLSGAVGCVAIYLHLTHAQILVCGSCEVLPRSLSALGVSVSCDCFFSSFNLRYSGLSLS